MALIDPVTYRFLDFGGHHVLGDPIHQCSRERGRPAQGLPSLRRGDDERAVLLGSAGALYVRGQVVAWDQLLPPNGRCVTLPAYPWQRERCWFTPAAQRHHANGHTKASEAEHFTDAPEDGVRSENWLVHLDWQPLTIQAPRAETPAIDGTWLLVADDSALTSALRHGLESCGAACVSTRLAA